jgi:hypothetical protein
LGQGQEPERISGDEGDRGVRAAKLMAKDFINDPAHWRNRVDETRKLAKRVSDDAARKRLSALATEYVRIALSVEDRINRMNDS